ncbi:class I SAM-dependent methyltransferase [Pseudonocardia hispaniensis]|uniref:Class I SAM-dependent methyltransferase n=1 Tax=Pseudonocardia hispaniensis TaxID=904933 RepID=A0ABW1J595_9PSEU
MNKATGAVRRSSHRHRRTPHDYLPGCAHDRLLPLYDLVQRLFGVPEQHRTLVDFAGLNRSRRTLEIGCGTGNLAILAKRLHPETEMVGIDPDQLALTRARHKASRGGIAISFDHGYGQDLPYPDATFDRVLSAFMFHHLEPDTKRATLREALRVLTPGGSLHLVDFGGRVRATDGLMARLQRRSQRVRDNLGDAIPNLMREAGFTDPAELTSRVSWAGRITFYEAVRGIPGSTG